MLSYVLLVQDVKHSLISVSSLCDDDHTVEYTNQKCVAKKKNCLVDVGAQAGGMYSVNLYRAHDKSLLTTDVSGDMLHDRLSRLAHADRSSSTKMAQLVSVRGLYMTGAGSTKKMFIFR